MVSQVLPALSGVLTLPFGEAAPARGKSESRAAVFVAGPENRVAAAAALQLLAAEQAAATEAQPTFSLLVLCGQSGVGKSHLATGLAAEYRRRTAAERSDDVIVLAAADFARQYADAIDTQSTSELTSRWRSARLLVIEDVQEIVERPWAQLELARTLDAVELAGGQVVVTARNLPGELGLHPTLAGRLLAGLVVRIAPPAPAAREQLTAQFAKRHGLVLSEGDVARLAAGIAGTARDLSAAVARLAVLRRERCERRVPTASESRETVSSAVRVVIAAFGRQSAPTLEAIASASARHFTLRPAQVRGLSRRRHVALARAVAMYVARERTTQSLEKIGRFFGGRDHTTVLHAWRKIQRQREADPRVRAAVDRVRELCQPTGKTE
ncbi:MAG: hypothetical protein K2Y37_13305 [Pirellulales bacterium]|nr:hypothetical protein [Pirellulales bacterium]